MRVSVAIAACVFACASIAAAAPLSIVPAPGAPQTFRVSFHSDEPHPREGGFYQVGGFYFGASGEDPALENAPDYLRDQKGMLTLTRTQSTVTIASQGALDSFYSPVNILAHGVLDPGGPPERFVVAFDNAAACFAAMPSDIAANGSWNGTIQVLTGVDALRNVPLAMKAISVNGGDVVAQGTGQANLTIAIGDNDQPALFDVTVNAEISGSALRSYVENITRTITNKNQTAKLNTTMSITAGAATPAPSATP